MDAERYKQHLLSYMNRAKLVSGGTAINCRCPECGDSRHLTSRHFYINLPTDDKPSMYFCHLCKAGGIVRYRKLIEWDVYDPDIAAFLENHNRNLSANGSAKSRRYFDQAVYNVRHTYIKQDQKTEYKRRYICDRIGRDLSCIDLAQLKVILNLGDLISENGIYKLTRHQSIVNELDREFVGFLSVDNAFLNMRRTCGEGVVYKTIDKRYVNYKLFDKIDTTQRFYTIPTRLDLNTPHRIPLHISEGPFDILSVYLNLRNMEPGIYTCVAGSNYYGVILYFMIDMQLPNLELHIYPDNDKYGSVEAIRKVIELLPDPTIPVYIHRNLAPGEKDFGVPMGRINESVLRMR